MSSPHHTSKWTSEIYALGEIETLTTTAALLQITVPESLRAVTAVFIRLNNPGDVTFHVQHARDFRWRISETELLDNAVDALTDTTTPADIDLLDTATVEQLAHALGVVSSPTTQWHCAVAVAVTLNPLGVPTTIVRTTQPTPAQLPMDTLALAATALQTRK